MQAPVRSAPATPVGTRVLTYAEALGEVALQRKLAERG